MTRLSAFNSKGFTIVELMIATTVFGVLMLIASAAVVSIGQQFYKGIVSARTQAVARGITEDVMRSIQFSASPVRVDSSGGGVQAYCIANRQYVLQENVALSSSSGPIFLSRNNCEPAGWPVASVTDLTGEVTEMMGENMRLAYFRLDPLDAEQQSWRLHLKVVYGEDDLLEDHDTADARCKSGILGAQFCSVSEMDVTVFKRLKV